MLVLGVIDMSVQNVGLLVMGHTGESVKNAGIQWGNLEYSVAYTGDDE